MEDLAAIWGVSQTGHHSWLTSGEHFLADKSRWSEEVSNDFRGNDCAFHLSLRDFGGDAATNGADLAFQLANTGFVGVIVDDQSKGLFGPFALLRFESVFLELSPNEIFSRDLQFFPFGVTRNRNGLHPIAEWSREFLLYNSRWQ